MSSSGHKECCYERGLKKILVAEAKREAKSKPRLASAVLSVIVAIDGATDPNKLDKGEQRIVLERVLCNINGRLDALDTENA